MRNLRNLVKIGEVPTAADRQGEVPAAADRQSGLAASPCPFGAKKGGGESGGPDLSVHLIATADYAFAARYQPFFSKMELYSKKWGYGWKVLHNEKYKHICKQSDVMHIRPCMVADFMEKCTSEDDVVIFFDADYVPYRFHRSLDTWLEKFFSPVKAREDEDASEQTPIDFAVYDRGFLNEIAAGSYFARNSPKVMEFLRGWANYYKRQPPGFSSADNGSMHIALLRQLGLEPEEGGECGNKYSNLTALVDNLRPYEEYLKCCRERGLQNGLHRHQNHPEDQFSILIADDVDPWAIDGVTENKEKELNGSVFHHGIKIKRKGFIAQDYIDKYDLEDMLPIIDNDCVQAVQARGREQCVGVHEHSTCTREARNFGCMSQSKCAIKAMEDPECGKYIMYSKSYPERGCRCCVVGDSPKFGTGEDLWGLCSIA